MSNYKDVDKIINELMETKIPVYDKAFSIRDIIGVLEKAPTADVQEIRHGKYKDFQKPLGFLTRICSYCNVRVAEAFFCQNCGAKMDGK